MKTELSLKQRLTDYRYLGYFSALMFSLILFFIGSTMHAPRDGAMFALFMIHACIALAGLFGYWFTDRNHPSRRDMGTVVLLSALISCYALNREISVFEETTPWMTVLLLTTGASLLAFRYADMMPAWARTATGIVAGVACSLYAYLALYLVPIYLIGLAGTLALGLGFHTFIPALLLWSTIAAIRRLKMGKPALIGVALSLISITIFCIFYSNTVQEINRIYNRSAIEGGNNLPAWVETSRRVQPGFITDRVLKTDLVYKQSRIMDDFFGFDMPGRNFGDRQYHDPLVTIASSVSPLLRPDKDDRIKILEALYDGRHEAQERLWSGDMLSTTYVHTKIRFWPAQHIAYTEKTLTVSNAGEWRQGEGIYSFQLPEGGVVTSLSLWINGKEEKAILTTKEKADTAYKTIVGVEMRDPSVVRWQEGNTVSVRVFPVLPKESRIFKIGITAPLKSHDGKMIYENIAFRGPVFKRATEYVGIETEGTELTDRRPSGFSRKGSLLEREGGYQPDWQLELTDIPLQPQTFAFNGNAYTIEPYKINRTTLPTTAIYLDVNHAWNTTDIAHILDMAGNIPVKAYAGDKFVTVTSNNFLEILDEQLNDRFSLFPFHQIADPAGAIVVTKSPGASPMLTDLEGSGFREKLAAKLADPVFPKIRLFNLSNELSPYLTSLKASRAFRYEKGTEDHLRMLLNKGLFAEDAESADKVVIDEAGAAITRRADSSATGTAPDHLMRLFAYNHILQQTGKGLITGSTGQEHLVAAAKEAYVVSPLSSLIVLETQKDYDRFGIADSGNSLKNASINGTGAVPEPHEWALIIIAVLSVSIYLKRRRWTVYNA